MKEIIAFIRLVFDWLWPIKTLWPESLLLSPFLKHAMMSPLTTIIINGQLALQESLACPTKQAVCLQSILHQASYLQSLVNCHLPTTHSFKLSPMCQEIVARFHQPHLHHFVYLTSACQIDCSLQGNRLLLQEAISCLVKNSLEAYPPGQQRKSVVIVCSQTDDQVSIFIGDNGCGMNKVTQHLAHISGFSRKGPDRGLGLTGVRQIITRHFHGRLLIASCPEVGTVVNLTLPILHHVAKPSDRFNQPSLRSQQNSQSSNINI